MNKSYKFFGYASLINEDSLKKTVPSAKNIFPVKVYGFVRVFNFESPTRYCKNKGCPASVLNIEKDEINQYVNGICFEIDEKDYGALLKREEGYELVEVDCFDYYDENKKFRGIFFRAPKYDAYPFQFGEPEQEEYLQICLEGCKKYGDKFLLEFKRTTFIGEKNLEEWGY